MRQISLISARPFTPNWTRNVFQPSCSNLVLAKLDNVLVVSWYMTLMSRHSWILSVLTIKWKKDNNSSPRGLFIETAQLLVSCVCGESGKQLHLWDGQKLAFGQDEKASELFSLPGYVCTSAIAIQSFTSTFLAKRTSMQSQQREKEEILPIFKRLKKKVIHFEKKGVTGGPSLA